MTFHVLKKDLFKETSYFYFEWMLSAFLSVTALGNDSVNNIYSRGKWTDFNKCLVTYSKHPINETNLFLHSAFLNVHSVICVQE